MTIQTPRVPWWEAEPSRLRRDRAEVIAAFPEVTFIEEGQGGWRGRLPLWPFERPAPAGLEALTLSKGLTFELRYGAAYPVVYPWIFPLDPEPEPMELTQTRWHVLGNGALCLFQTQQDWDPASSVVDLLRRAAGWRIEYALLRSGALQSMTLAGIVRDSALDELIAAAPPLPPTAVLTHEADGTDEADRIGEDIMEPQAWTPECHP